MDYLDLSSILNIFTALDFLPPIASLSIDCLEVKTSGEEFFSCRVTGRFVCFSKIYQMMHSACDSSCYPCLLIPIMVIFILQIQISSQYLVWMNSVLEVLSTGGLFFLTCLYWERSQAGNLLSHHVTFLFTIFFCCSFSWCRLALKISVFVCVDQCG
jgi:hypothetical protein